MRNIELIQVLFWVCFSLFGKMQAQSGAASHVSTIETKVNQILQNERDIKSLNQRILDTEKNIVAEKENAKNNLAKAEQHVLTDENWKNRLETARRGWVEYKSGTCSAGGPPPICPANHWYRDPASAMDSYNRYKEQYLDQFRRAIKAVDRRQREITEAKNSIVQKNLDIERLKKEIVEESKKYEDKVKELARTRASTAGKALIVIVASLHHNQALLNKINLAMADNEQQKESQKKSATEKVSQELRKLLDKIEEDIKQLELRKEEAIQAITQRRTKTDSEISRLVAENKRLDEELYNFKGDERAKEQLRSRIEANNNSADRFRKAKAEDEQQLASTRSEFDGNIRKLYDERHKLNADEQGLIAQALAIVNKAFADKQALLNESKNATLLKIDALETSYSKTLSEKNAEFGTWSAIVDTERKRIMALCPQVSVSCYATGAVNDVNLIWNTKFKDCVQALYRKTFLIAGCEEALQYYRELLGNYGGDDVESKRKENQNKIKNRLDGLSK